MSSAWKTKVAGLESQLIPLSTSFRSNGFKLFLVGGIVRDSALGSLSPDVDLTTDARPEDIKRLLSPLVSALWDQGERFGTIGGKFGELDLEITTFRGESYSQDSRKPEVVFGDSIEIDLGRRDFTINAMAVELPGLVLVDPFNGMTDLENKELRTPFDPVDSFTDDPLRVLRAARFTARLGLSVAEDVVAAAVETKDRLGVVSAERISDELEKLLLVDDMSSGVNFLAESQAWERIFGWVWSDTQLKAVNQALADLHTPLERRVALFYSAPDVGVSLRTLKSSNAIIVETVSVDNCLKELANEEVSPETIREFCVRYSQSDVNSAIAVGKSLSVESVAHHATNFLSLSESGELDQLNVPVTGSEVMHRYGLAEGKLVGDLLAVVQQQIIERGPMEVSDVWKTLDAEIAPG